jgi:hypothetical protein
MLHVQWDSIESSIQSTWLLAICIGKIPHDTNCVSYLVQCWTGGGDRVLKGEVVWIGLEGIISKGIKTHESMRRDGQETFITFKSLL